MTLKQFIGSAPGPKGPDGPQGPPGGNKGVSWPLRTDKWYGAWQYGRQSGFSRANHLQAYPFVVARRRNFVSIDYWCTQGGSTGLIPPTSHHLLAGVWADAGGYPGALLTSGMPHENFEGGLKSSPIDLTLEPGLYWLAGVCSSSTSAAFMIHNRQVKHDVSILYEIPGLPLGGTFWNVDFPFDGTQALPNPFPTNGVLNGGIDDVPYVIGLLTAAPTTQFDDVDSGWDFDPENPDVMEFDLEKGLLVYP